MKTLLHEYGQRALLPLVLMCAAAVTASAAPSDKGHCKDLSSDVAGCQPSPFETPIGDIPSTRVNTNGTVDHFSSDKDARIGARHLEKKLGLFRNFKHLHWVTVVPSVTDPATGEKSGGDLDGRGDGRGLAIAGNCIFVGHRNSGATARAINILRLQDDPERKPPVMVGEIPAQGGGYDDRELRAVLYTNSNSQDTMLLVRDASRGQDGRLIAYTINPATCLPVAQSQTFFMGGELHEFFMWIDPKLPTRILIFTAAWGGSGRPDPNEPGRLTPDIRAIAVTDENTGDMLPVPQQLATHMLQDAGGPILNEFPDANGLFRDGRFPDFSHLTDSYGVPGASQTRQRNYVHSLSVSEDGERVYVAGSQAGFYILNSEGVANASNADLIAGTAGCNKHSTNVYVGAVIGGDIDIAKLADIANDCLHMVINDDPGVKNLLTSGSPNAITAYLKLQDRSRFDIHPPVLTFTGIHSAVFVPNRPSLNKDNTKNRPGLVVVTDEKPTNECPATSMYIMNVDSEVTPMMHGAFALPIHQLENCLTQASTEPNGDPRQRRSQQAHNPTVFKNMVFLSWYGQGIRAVDISLPQTPREVGYAITVPHGQARTYPVFKDGLIYWVDNSNGLHVAQYTGPRANELPGPGSGIFEGNSTSPHR